MLTDVSALTIRLDKFYPVHSTIGRVLFVFVDNRNGCRDKKRTYCFSYHAEVLSFFRVPKRFRKRISLLVIRLGPDGTFKHSRPCESCVKFFAGKNIVVYYSTGNEDEIEKIKL